MTLFSQSRSSVPGVASASSPVSPSPFALLFRSLPIRPPSRRNGKITRRRTNGLSDDPTTSKYAIGHAPVPCENDGQTDPARKYTDSDVERRIVAPHAPHDQHQGPLQNQPPPPDASRLRVLVWPHAGCQRRLSSSPPLQKAIRPNLTPANVTETEDHEPLDIICVNTSSSSSLSPPPHRAACARPRNGGDRGN
ncbi:hypothetical protein EDB92DRAFT_1889994 [Lactarius akahatsu]|uniref:Uncharacterized protein n=1 Tax=Lactarius akahatsu TaxID=416441 RepID=A0AAD4L8G1_9AGAM|nr:hypothetical protein EDB92DRAFT_1889994 [Lactarius akahatsu]